MPTTPTQIRLTDEDRRKLAVIQEWAGLPSLAASVRFAINQVHLTIPGKSAKKSRKGA